MLGYTLKTVQFLFGMDRKFFRHVKIRGKANLTIFKNNCFGWSMCVCLFVYCMKEEHILLKLILKLHLIWINDERNDAYFVYK